jgi:hypothetical protein
LILTLSNSIQEADGTYYLPLEPVRNPAASTMDETNSNRALPMGAIGVATNGVMFFNPFEAGGMEAVKMHKDDQRGWHYHVTPGKFPYIIGGFAGSADRRNLRRGPRG